MPTEKPRIMITLEEGMPQAIENYRTLNGLKSTSKAINELILKGLSGFDSLSSKTSVFTNDEIKFIALFRKLTDAARNEIMRSITFAPQDRPRMIVGRAMPEKEFHVIDSRDLDCFIKAFPRMSTTDQRALLFEMLEKSGMLTDADYADLIQDESVSLSTSRIVSEQDDVKSST